jgi:hypothetical protein
VKENFLKDGRKVKDNLQKMGARCRRIFKRWEQGERESSKDKRKVKENLQKMGER